MPIVQFLIRKIVKLTVGVREGQKEKLNALFTQAGVTGYKRKPGNVISAGLQALADGNLRLENVDLLQDIQRLVNGIILKKDDPNKPDVERIKTLLDNALTDHKIRQGLLKQKS